MRVEKTYEKDAGPVVRWIATALLSFLHMIERPLYDYAEMYEVIDFEDDEEDNLNAKFTESFGDDWGNDDDYFEGAAI